MRDASLWEVDASRGGGQLVRTALTVAALVGRPCRLTGIRRKRDRPGLQRQHLAAVRAVAEAAGGRLAGDELGSAELRFEPGDASGPLDLVVDIGTAGSTTLVLQALLPLLVRRGGRVRVTGGTDNPLAPPIDYLREVFAPALGELGVRIGIELEQRGFHPQGGGVVTAWAEPGSFAPVRRVAWGPPARIGGVVYAAHLPGHIPARLARAVAEELRLGAGLTDEAHSRLQAVPQAIEVREAEPAVSPGCGVVLWAEDEQGRRLGGSALGERGKPAERVGAEAARDLLGALASGAACDEHLGDQLAVWAALAPEPSEWSTARCTEHLGAVLKLLESGLAVRWTVRGRVVSLRPATTTAP